MSTNGKFRLLGPDDTMLFETLSQHVFISSMLYVPQLAALIIGYNFGAFQVINLSTLTIE